MLSVKVAVVLTMWRAPQRADMYDSRIKWWETHVARPDALFLLDSYGSLHNSSQTLSFDQTKRFGTVKRRSSSTYELFALKAALDQWQAEFRRFDYVVKVTCKYVVPGLLEWFHSQAPTTSLVLQSFGISNTEVLGIRSDELRAILQQLTEKNDVQCCIESALLQVKRQYSVRKMPRFAVPSSFQTKRGAGDVLPYLRA